MMSNRQINPLVALEFTPALARLLAENPERLVKVAETHRRWLLANVHPDLREFGNEDRARIFTEALADLKDPARRAAAIEAFLTGHDRERDAGVSELRVAREQLKRTEERAAKLTEEVRKREELLERAEERLGSSLALWFRRAALHENLLPFEEGGKVTDISLNGSLLLLSAVRTGYVSLIVIGENRSVIYSEQWPTSRAEKLELLAKGRLRERRNLKLFGTYRGERSGPERSIMLSHDHLPGGEDLRALGIEISPVLKMGQMVVLSDGRLDGSIHLWVSGRLRAIKSGVVTLFGAKSKQNPGRFTWNPAE